MGLDLEWTETRETDDHTCDHCSFPTINVMRAALSSFGYCDFLAVMDLE